MVQIYTAEAREQSESHPGFKRGDERWLVRQNW